MSAKPEERGGSGWRMALGSGVLLGLGIGCVWLAVVLRLAYVRVLLSGTAVALVMLSLMLAAAPREAARSGWAVLWQRRLESRFTAGGIPFFVALTVLALAALTSGNNLFYLLVAGMLAALVVSGMASSWNLSGLALHLRMPGELVAGEAALVQFTVENQKRWGSAYGLTVAARSTQAGALAEMEPVYFGYLPAAGRAEAHSRMAFPRRGAYAAAAFTVSTRFPFGLVRKRRHFRVEGAGGREPELVVFPRAAAVGRGPESRPRGGAGAEQPRRGSGQEMLQLRPHRAGDSARSVHWKATARVGGMQVREFSDDAQAHVRLRLAVPAGVAAEAGERAVEECAGWLEALMAADAGLEFVGENPGRDGVGVYLPAAAARQQRRKLLDYLAVVDVAQAAVPQRGGAGGVEILLRGLE